MATDSAKSKALLAEIAAKKTVKPAAKKPAAPKPVDVVAVTPKVEAKPKKKVEETPLLYTFRLHPELIAKLNARGAERGVTHAQVAREAIFHYFATVK